jgi:hypothetical protein
MNGQIGYYGRIVSRASNSKNVAFVFRFWQRLGFIQTSAGHQQCLGLLSPRALRFCVFTGVSFLRQPLPPPLLSL